MTFRNWYTSQQRRRSGDPDLRCDRRRRRHQRQAIRPRPEEARRRQDPDHPHQLAGRLQLRRHGDLQPLLATGAQDRPHRRHRRLGGVRHRHGRRRDHHAGQCAMMVHRPYALVLGNAADMQAMVEALDRVEGTRWFSPTSAAASPTSRSKRCSPPRPGCDAKEAVDLGFADRVADPVKIAAVV